MAIINVKNYLNVNNSRIYRELVSAAINEKATLTSIPTYVITRKEFDEFDAIGNKLNEIKNKIEELKEDISEAEVVNLKWKVKMHKSELKNLKKEYRITQQFYETIRMKSMKSFVEKYKLSMLKNTSEEQKEWKAKVDDKIKEVNKKFNYQYRLNQGDMIIVADF